MPYDTDTSKMLDPSTRKWIYLPVFECAGTGGDDDNEFIGYTVIRAQPPPEWNLSIIEVGDFMLAQMRRLTRFLE